MEKIGIFIRKEKKRLEVFMYYFVPPGSKQMRFRSHYRFFKSKIFFVKKNKNFHIGLEQNFFQFFIFFENFYCVQKCL